MSAPIAIGMLVQTLYFIVDLYFVAGLGEHAIAGVSAAGTVMFIVMALTQMLSVGTVTLISHAAGRKDQTDANLVFNQTLLISAFCALLTLVLGYAFAEPFMRGISADQSTLLAGQQYLYAYIPGLALQFALVAMSAALRGTGVVKPTMVVQLLTVLLNIILAPILIAGWGTGHAFGVVGAGLASTIAVTAGVVFLGYYFVKLEHYVAFTTKYMRPQLAVWKRLFAIGLPAGGEMLCMFVLIAVIYGIIGQFGASAQAGFGVGSRVMQAIFLPVMALSFAIAPIAGQNFGAKLNDRVRETVRKTIYLESGIMLVVTLLCQINPELFIRGFSHDPAVIAFGAQYLRIISWNFVAQGIIFSCSGTFQALGNTLPALYSMVSRMVTFVVPALWLAKQEDFSITDVWYLSVATVALQALTSLWLVRQQLDRKLLTPTTTELSSTD